MGFELSITKDMADKLKLSCQKTENIEPDINHWYAKVMIFSRKRYVLATNTMTRFAVLFRLNSKTMPEDFTAAFTKELEKYGMNSSGIAVEGVAVTLGNSKSCTAQLNTCGQELTYRYEYYGRYLDESNLYEFFGEYNKHNLGKAGIGDGMVFALDEMRKYY